MPDDTAVAATDSALPAAGPAPAPAPSPEPAPATPPRPDVPAPIGDPPSADEWQHVRDEIAAERAADDAALEALRRDWGGAFDTNVALAERLMDEVAGPELVAALDRSGLAANPFLLRAAAEVAQRLYTRAPAAPRAERRDAERIRTRLDELHALQFHDDPQRRDSYRSTPVQGELERLYAALYGTQPVVGRESRVA